MQRSLQIDGDFLKKVSACAIDALATLFVCVCVCVCGFPLSQSPSRGVVNRPKASEGYNVYPDIDR